MIELKPCPFCGSPAHLWETYETKYTQYYVACVGCRNQTKLLETKEEAIERWERRTTDV